MRIERMVEELVADGCLGWLERLGVVRLVRFDVITTASGVAAPIRTCYTVNTGAMLFFSLLIVLVFALHRISRRWAYTRYP
jgi:hypothetical protein